MAMVDDESVVFYENLIHRHPEDSPQAKMHHSQLGSGEVDE